MKQTTSLAWLKWERKLFAWPGFPWGQAELVGRQLTEAKGAGDRKRVHCPCVSFALVGNLQT